MAGASGRRLAYEGKRGDGGGRGGLVSREGRVVLGGVHKTDGCLTYGSEGFPLVYMDSQVRMDGVWMASLPRPLPPTSQ